MKRWLCLAVALVGLALAGIGVYETVCDGWKAGQELVTVGLIVTVMVIVNLPSKDKEHKPPTPHQKP